jgi:hypothetical protein
LLLKWPVKRHMPFEIAFESLKTIFFKIILIY